jgi:hypothetical protein
MLKKIVTYSLLAHINNTGTLSNNYEDIFMPLVKRGLSKMCDCGQFKGDSIFDIKKYVDEIYALDIPLPFLKKILKKIEASVNTENSEFIKFHDDNSFIINNYTFVDFEEEIINKEKEIEQLESIFLDFRKANNSDLDSSIFEFLERNKISLGKFIGKRHSEKQIDFTQQALFINFIKDIPQVYKTFQLIYIGSIISTYLEYEPTKIASSVELLLDTNFVIGLLDLNTKESTHSCKKLLELAGKLGYKISVLDITVRETEGLLSNRIEFYHSSFLSRLIDKEDIYNACERRSLTKTDLERIKDNIEKELGKNGVVVISNTQAYQNRAKHSHDYENLLKVRNTTFAALHDSTCLDYVRTKRTKKIFEFNKVNCWFVNNSSSNSSHFLQNKEQPLTIKGEDLLNMLWLTSPMVKSDIENAEFANIGLTRLISTTLNDALPNSAIINELDDNIKKYAQDIISDEDIVRVSKGIAQRTIMNIDGLNEVAKKDEKKFVSHLQQIANEQKQKEEQMQNILEKVVKELKGKMVETETTKEKYEKVITREKELEKELLNAKNNLIKIQNESRKITREKLIRKKKRNWRLKSWAEVLLLPLIATIVTMWYLNSLGWNWNRFTSDFLQGHFKILISIILWIGSTVLIVVFLPSLRDKYKNLTLIEKFEQRIQIPEDLKEVQIMNE